MAKIGYINSETSNKKIEEQFIYENWFSYEWVLEQLSKDVDIEGIDRIGFTTDSYEVFIVTDDDLLSDIPHFHYRKKEKGKPCEFHACIRFDRSEYYHHTGEENILKEKQKEELVKFLNSKKNAITFNMTNWEYLIMSWNTNNDNVKIDDDLSMPDYQNLK